MTELEKTDVEKCEEWITKSRIIEVIDINGNRVAAVSSITAIEQIMARFNPLPIVIPSVDISMPVLKT